MKYLVSIVMVLLMVNLFANAQSAADKATPLDPGATAVPIDPATIETKPDPNSHYAKKTIPGRDAGATQGGRAPCDKNGNRNCNPSPKTTVTSRKGAKGKGTGAKVDPAATTKTGNQTQ